MRKSAFILGIAMLLMAYIDTRSQSAGNTHPADKSLAIEMAATIMEVWQARPQRWSYDQGVQLEGIEGVWKRTANGEYFKYMQKCMDDFVSPSGEIDTYKDDSFNIDNVKNGRTLLTLYKVTGQEKYFKAATLLWHQLQNQPRTKEGGFWHKQIYPNQMWLDGLYMGEPFYAEYASLIQNEEAYDDIANQFILMEKNARDSKTGLLYHGWDESREQKWADKSTGRSPHYWARAMGWYALALVDVLDYFPKNHPKRKELISILARTADAIKKVQDKSGVWFDILNLPEAKGNYLESSASSMFVCAIAKGVRQGYLPESYFSIAEKGYQGIQQEFIEQRAEGKINLKGTVTVSGLGGKPYRDGSYAYYMSEKVITNDAKGVGAFLMAANEMELAALPKLRKTKVVLLDSYYNNETKTDQSGHIIPWHYKWDEPDNGGYSFFGTIFNNAGFETKTLTEAPTSKNLRNTDVYIIADPDIEKENPKPAFITPVQTKVITDWVKTGGILIMMANDTGNVELDHFNQLASNFGIQFKKDSKNRVTKSEFERGRVMVNEGNEVFKSAKKLYIKEYSSLKLSLTAKSILKDVDGDNVIAISKFGKGMVLAVGDPWLYNEYVDGRKLPASFDNFKAAEDLVQWLSKQIE